MEAARAAEQALREKQSLVRPADPLLEGKKERAAALHLQVQTLRSKEEALGGWETHEARRQQLEREVLSDARNTFAPEFLNRLDGCLVFHPLEQKTLERIARQLLEETAGRLRACGVALEAEGEAVALLAPAPGRV